MGILPHRGNALSAQGNALIVLLIFRENGITAIAGRVQLE